jgi:hypothetical protein
VARIASSSKALTAAMCSATTPGSSLVMVCSSQEADRSGRLLFPQSRVADAHQHIDDGLKRLLGRPEWGGPDTFQHCELNGCVPLDG